MKLWTQSESVEVSAILKVGLPLQELGCHP